MYCKHCGQELADTDVYCTNCGKSVQEDTLPAVIPEDRQEPEKKVKEKASFAWAVLGFFFPIAGLVFFIVWRKAHPDVSLRAGIGALVGAIVEVIATIFAIIISIIATVIPLAIIYGDVGAAAISML